MRLLLGCLLLIAAGLKLAGRGVSAVPQVGWFATPTVQIATAEWEIVLGLWLLSGRGQIGAWLAALTTFLAFAGVSAYLGWSGVASCGCFGTIHASPWWAFGVDVAAVLLIALFHPRLVTLRERPLAKITRLAAHGLAYATVIVGILTLGTGAATAAFGSPAAALARLRGEQVTIDQSLVDFGTGEVGQTLEANVTVRNWTERPVRIVGGTSDCSCMTTDGLPTTLPPRGRQTIPLRLRLKRVNAGVYTRTALLWTDDGKAIHLYLTCMVK